MVIRSRIRKTYFEDDSIAFQEKTSLRIPSQIITEWKKNVESDEFISYWNEGLLNEVDTIYIGGDTILEKRPIIRCLSRDEEDLHFKKSNDLNPIYAFSKMLFDDSRENAIFNFYQIWRPGYAGGCTILIKKVFGKWVIVTKYNSWIG